MDDRLPLKFRVAIRDLWDSDDAAVQVARRAVEDILGLKVHLAPEWPQLLHELGMIYSDRESLVVAVAGCMTVWYKVFAGLMEEAENADRAQREWLEIVLESASRRSNPRGSGLQCFVEVGEASTKWSVELSAFVVQIPRKVVTLPTELAASFRGAILTCFDDRRNKGQTKGTGDTRDPTEWADVTIDQATGTAAIIAPTTVVPQDYLPSVESLPRPDDLFRCPPYYLTVTDFGLDEITVQGSHSASLQVLGGYFQRWCRVNHQNTSHPPAVNVSLSQSCWATGVFFDQVTFSAKQGPRQPAFSINATDVLAFVEGVLGYHRVATKGRLWIFRRDVAFQE